MFSRLDWLNSILDISKLFKGEWPNAASQNKGEKNVIDMNVVKISNTSDSKTRHMIRIRRAWLLMKDCFWNSTLPLFLIT